MTPPSLTVCHKYFCLRKWERLFTGDILIRWAVFFTIQVPCVPFVTWLFVSWKSSCAQGSGVPLYRVVAVSGSIGLATRITPAAPRGIKWKPIMQMVISELHVARHELALCLDLWFPVKT